MKPIQTRKNSSLAAPIRLVRDPSIDEPPPAPKQAATNDKKV